MNWLLLNNLYPVTPYRRVREESDGLLYAVLRSLVTVRNQLPAQVVEIARISTSLQSREIEQKRGTDFHCRGSRLPLYRLNDDI